MNLLMNVLRGLTHGLSRPLAMAKERPVLFGLIAGVGVLFIGNWQGWWSLDFLSGLFSGAEE